MKTSAKYHYKVIDESEVSLLQQLYKDAFNRSKPDHYFEWKYINNPSGMVKGFMALDQKNQPAAFYAFLPQSLVVNGKKEVFYFSCDGMTHPEHQRQGLFKKLHAMGNQYLDDHHQVCMAYAGLKTLNYKLSTGWEAVDMMKTYFYPAQFAIVGKKSSEKFVLGVESIEQIAHLLNKGDDTRPVYHLKNLEIYKWRLANPQREYNIIGYQKTNKFTSFLVYTIQHNKIDIFDFYIHSKNEGKALRSKLLSIVQDNKYDGIVCLVNENSQNSETLRALGFIKNPFKKGPATVKYPFSIYSADSVLKEKLMNRANWNLNSFEFDGT